MTIKKYLVFFLLFALLLSQTACSGNIRHVSQNYGSSALYSRHDIGQAMKAVKAQFRTFTGCRLYSLSYAGDEASAQELQAQRTMREINFSACIVLNSSFRSPIKGGGAWNANRIYTWNWIIVKKPGGRWFLLDYGYC